MTDEALKFIISRVLRNADENLAEIKKNGSDDFSDGKRLAYYETLDIIKNELIIEGEDLSKFGLDKDIDLYA